ncbi:Fic family protein [Rhizobium sp. LC145]|jgi:cell filamentation protein|uniref:Fic/DOC family protein n=1 Tax=Rhizobium sp. LC145 TaxID=1120688 RepID=UPI000629F665|nr:Fic family protein [Rhizobium sp. LC145]KKX30594.1 cell division protein [Rhizobium sp. LC145]TKT59363.1 cell division protein [Rhizobiaceae bacterium LC148]
MSDPYVYPGTGVLRNKLGIQDAEKLDYYEREIVTMRVGEGIPSGNFDLQHLKAIHRHLFQDIFEWAGQIRTVEISKGGSQFQFQQYIETGMADVHRRLMKSDFLRGLEQSVFAAEAGKIIGDVNYVHPFREGNGRTQLLYLKQLAEQAGHPLDLTKIEAAGWLAASKEAHRARYDLMGQVIGDALRRTPPTV